jgi:hypothetical protein
LKAPFSSWSVGVPRAVLHFQQSISNLFPFHFHSNMSTLPFATVDMLEDKRDISASYDIDIAIVVTSDGNVTTVPMSAGSGVAGRIDSSVPMQIIISGDDCGHPDVALATTTTCIEKTGDYLKLQHIKPAAVFASVWKAIKAANSDDLYRRGGRAWKDFMDDIVIFYVARQMLFNKPIPIVDHPDMIKRMVDLEKKGKSRSKGGRKA